MLRNDVNTLALDAQIAISVESLVTAGGRFILLAGGGKAPIKGQPWMHGPRPQPSEVVQHLKSGGGIGIQPSSVGCAAIDLDGGGLPVFSKIADWLYSVGCHLSDRTWLQSRAGEMRGHILFRCADLGLYSQKWTGWGGGHGEVIYNGYIKLHSIHDDDMARIARLLDHKSGWQMPAEVMRDFLQGPEPLL